MIGLHYKKIKAAEWCEKKKITDVSQILGDAVVAEEFCTNVEILKFQQRKIMQDVEELTTNLGGGEAKLDKVANDVPAVAAVADAPKVVENDTLVVESPKQSTEVVAFKKAVGVSEEKKSGVV